MTKAWTIRTLAAIVVAAMLGISACGNGTGDKGSSPAPETGPKLTAEQAKVMYGGEVKPTSDVTLQPDVVVVEGGPRIIRRVSDDGLVWTIDSRAKGAAEIEPGKIMFATSKALGRVVTAEKSGDELEVMLEPVELTEIFKDADIKIDEAIDPARIAALPMPGLPDALTQSEGETASPKATVTPSGWSEPSLRGEGQLRAESATYTADVSQANHASLRAAPAGWPAPPPTEGERNSFKMTVGDWELEPVMRSSSAPEGRALDFTMNALYKFHDKFRVGLSASIRATNLRVKSNTSISNGSVGSSSFVLEGLNGIAVKMYGGTATANGNLKFKVEVPFEWPIEIIWGGIPFIVVFKFKILVELGFVGKNSNMVANLVYGLSGALGIASGQLVIPAITPPISPADNLKGIPVGPSGMVYGFEFRAQYALGVPSAYTGPYAKLTAVFGNTMGGAIDTLTGDCKQAVTYVDLAGGWGLQISSANSKIIEKILGKKIKKLELVNESSMRILDKEDWLPKVVRCKP